MGPARHHEMCGSEVVKERKKRNIGAQTNIARFSLVNWFCTYVQFMVFVETTKYKTKRRKKNGLRGLKVCPLLRVDVTKKVESPRISHLPYIEKSTLEILTSVRWRENFETEHIYLCFSRQRNHAYDGN